MKMNKSLLIAGAITTLGTVGLLGSTVANATFGGDPNSDIASRIAQKFNLKESDVQSVIDEANTEREAKHWAKVSERLQKHVNEGKITADQKTAIENKIKEVKAAKAEDMKNLQTWANENKIDLKYVLMRGHTANLDQAVTDGMITADQKTAIEEKRKAVEQKFTEDRDALKKWATDNNLGNEYLKLMAWGKPSGDMHSTN